MPTWLSYLLLCLLSSVHAAFTEPQCDLTRALCIERSPSGSVCVYSIYSTEAWECNGSYQLPLRAHLNQGYSIGYYSASGQHLGGWNFTFPDLTTPIYVCMSARLNNTSSQYVTVCALTTANNSWQGGGCIVNVVPANVLDGCYVGPNSTTTTTRVTTLISATGNDQSGGLLTTATIMPDPLPTRSISIKRNILKDSGYSVILIPIAIFLAVRL